MPIIPTLRRLRHEDYYEFEYSLGYKVQGECGLSGETSSQNKVKKSLT